MTAIPIHRVLAALPDAHPEAAGRWRARCPSHDDRRASLGLREEEDGTVLLRCRASCQTEAVVGALGLEMRDLFLPRPGSSPGANGHRPAVGKTQEVRHQDRDLAGNVVAVHCREVDPVTGKKLGPVWWEQPDGTRGLGGLRVEALPLFGSEDLPGLEDGSEVFVTEGEPARVALAWAGVPAVATVTGAATIPSDDMLRCLVRLRVVLWPDADDPGAEHMRRIAARLVNLGCPSVELIEPPVDVPRGWDAADLLHPLAPARDAVADRAAVDALPRRPWSPPEPEPAAGRTIDATQRQMEPGADVLDAVHAFLVAHVAFPSREGADAVTLWAAHCHLVACFESTPRLALLSPEKQSGKTRTLEVLRLLVPNPFEVANTSAAALFRLVEKSPTILMDECDTYFGRHAAAQHEDIRRKFGRPLNSG
jgi:hypothetical protein